MSLVHIGIAARQRIADWQNEHRIYLASKSCKAAMAAGDKDEAREHWNTMAEAIKARSPAQVARMDRAIMKHSGSPGSR